jgi:hypothetical protein
LFFSTTHKNLVAIFEATLCLHWRIFVFFRIPGRLNDRRTPLGELNWIFTAVTDTIAWNVLPRGRCFTNHSLSEKPSEKRPSSGVNRLMTNYVVSFCCLFKMNNTKSLSFHFFQSCSKDFFDKTYWLLVYSVIFYWQKESWDRIIAHQCHAHSYHQLINILCGKYAPPQVISL